MPSRKPGKPRKATLQGFNAAEVVKAFGRAGFVVSRQAGSHIIMHKPGHPFRVVVPAHRPVAEGTLKSCIRAAGLTTEQFAQLLDA